MLANPEPRAGLPLVVDIAGVRCLCVGGGSVAARRVPVLLDAGGLVTIIAPELNPALKRIAGSGAITHLRREYQPGDTEGAFLVLAATNDEAVNRSIAEEAEFTKVLICVASQPALGNCAFPATIKRGSLTIALHTGGSSPGVAHALRARIESVIPSDVGELLSRLRDARAELKVLLPDPASRAAAWQRVAASGDLERALDGDATAVSRIRAILGLDA